MKKGNIVQIKSFEFAKEIILFSHELEAKKLFSLKDQVFRSGTSIGANVEEALGSRSRKEFVSKLSIAYFEARETAYWLKLIEETQDLEVKNLIEDCEVLLKIIGKIQITIKKNS
jgi:four helix bundle protein